jgi:hypothetical protein
MGNGEKEWKIDGYRIRKREINDKEWLRKENERTKNIRRKRNKSRENTKQRKKGEYGIG